MSAPHHTRRVSVLYHLCTQHSHAHHNFRTGSSRGADLRTYVHKCLLDLFQRWYRGMSVVLTSEPGVDSLQAAVGAAPACIVSLVLHGSIAAEPTQEDQDTQSVDVGLVPLGNRG